VEVAEDAMAGADDRRRLALDEDPKSFRVTGEDGLDRPASLGVRG
jgi:hypothetical protein